MYLGSTPQQTFDAAKPAASSISFWDSMSPLSKAAIAFTTGVVLYGWARKHLGGRR